MIKIAHIVNPVSAAPGSELSIVQPITFETIRVARDFCPSDMQVELLSVSYPEDYGVIPGFFSKAKDLDRSVLDMGTFTSAKKLPLISDILHRLADTTDADWLMYTNADICLMPQFYTAVRTMIDRGHDAMLITRRRVSREYTSVAQLPIMYSDIGAPHPGYDCFVFHRSLLDRFILDGICIGVPFLEVSLLHNFIAFASSLRHVDDLHLTFHIGMEVMPPVDPELYRYNRSVYEKNIRPLLKPYLNIAKFPYFTLPIHHRLLKWILNPCYSSALVLELEGKNALRKVKIVLDEARWRIVGH
jgi:hypothetical protein